MVGERLLKPMTVTLGRQAKGHWLLRRRVVLSILGGAAATAFHLVSARRAQQTLSTTHSRLDTVSVGKLPRRDYTYQRVEPLFYSHQEAHT
jgi:hypothetical protein